MRARNFSKHNGFAHHHRRQRALSSERSPSRLVPPVRPARAIEDASLAIPSHGRGKLHGKAGRKTR